MSRMHLAMLGHSDRTAVGLQTAGAEVLAAVCQSSPGTEQLLLVGQLQDGQLSVLRAFNTENVFPWQKKGPAS